MITVVLDTNIFINAIWALNKSEQKEPVPKHEADCLTIIEILEKKLFNIKCSYRVRKEYFQKLDEYLEHNAKGKETIKKYKLNPNHTRYVLKIMDTMTQRCGRLQVDPIIYSKDADDNILFDGLSADYLISANLKDLVPSKLLTRTSPYKETISPTEFLKILKIK